MSEEAYRQLKALLFGQSPYERYSAPEPELLIDLAPAMDASLLAYAYHTLRAIAFMRGPERLRGLVRLLERAGVDTSEWLSHLGESLWQYPDLAGEIPEDLLPAALRAIESVEWHDERRAMVLSALAKRREGSSSEQAQAALRDEFHYLAGVIATDTSKGAALLFLLKDPEFSLTEEMCDVLLSSIEGVKNSALRARLYTGILPHVAGEKRAKAAKRAMEAAREIVSDATRAMALVDFSDQLTEPEKKKILDEAITIAQRMEGSHPARMAIWAELLLRVPPGNRGEILRIAKEGYAEKVIWPSADEALAEAFASIAENVPESLQGLMREQVAALSVPHHALGDLAPFLSEQQLSAALDHAVKLQETPFGPEAHLLSRLAPYLSEELLSTAVKMAADVPSHREDLRAKIIMALVPSLRFRVVLEAMAVAQNMEALWWRGRTLHALLPRLPSLYQRELMPLVETVSPERMCGLLRELAYSDHVELLTRAMDTIWDYYGGGAAPPEELEAAKGAEPEVSAEMAGAAEEAEGEEAAGVTERGVFSIEELPMDETFVPVSDNASGGPVAGPGGPTRAEKRAPAPKAEKKCRSKEGVVNTGFAPEEEPASPIPPDMPLKRSTDYFFWLEVGSHRPESIEETPIPLPKEHLPEEATLHVVLYPFEGGIRVKEEANVGELQLMKSGEVVALRQPVALPDQMKDSPLAMARLFFPVQTPSRAGTYPLRCNIYYNRLLVQSRTIRARVMATPKKAKGALRSTLDYNLAHALRPEDLTTAPHRLSVMLNDNGDGTHSFRFFGEGDFVSNARLDAHELQDMIRQARGALRQTAWGDEEEWREGKSYRYGGPPEPARLRQDLVRLAIRGYRFYDHMIDSLAGDGDVDQLNDLMRTPGLVQVAFKESERLLIPAALIYDRPLDTSLSTHELCGAFSEALEGQERLEESPCFLGMCPTYGQDHVVCPSGFWGFRHAMGMPISIGKGGSAAQPIITHGDSPGMVMGVFKGFALLDAHESQLAELTKGKGWHLRTGDRRADVISMMRDEKPSLVYFYCHGGLQGTLPYIRVGTPREKGITRDNLRNSRIRWKENRPLVFINGCHTTALEPEKAFNFVGAFVRTAHASGVIGTEITVFEPLAGRFAEEFFERFVAGEPVGGAVRGARLALLKNGNPLGLVYIPFALADLRLVREGSG